MNDPFKFPAQTHIAFSGGRTSGYMLWRAIQAHGGSLPETVVPIFCNTGKERPQTLDFVEQCSQHWGIKIIWLEFKSRAKMGFNVVNYATASSQGEPFERLIHTKHRLPNVVQRSCTEWLKVLTSHRYCRWVLGWQYYDTAIGYRFDEPGRVAKMGPDDRTPGEEPFAPLYQARISKPEILAWWKAQPFDLQLPPDESNCDLCFLKGLNQNIRTIKSDPSVADWWIEQERWVSEKTSGHSTFKKGRSVLSLVKEANAGTLFPEEENFPVCRCTD